MSSISSVPAPFSPLPYLHLTSVDMRLILDFLSSSAISRKTNPPFFVESWRKKTTRSTS
jgi:hypothetical protein